MHKIVPEQSRWADHSYFNPCSSVFAFRSERENNSDNRVGFSKGPGCTTSMWECICSVWWQGQGTNAHRIRLKNTLLCWHANVYSSEITWNPTLMLKDLLMLLLFSLSVGVWCTRLSTFSTGDCWVFLLCLLSDSLWNVWSPEVTSVFQTEPHVVHSSDTGPECLSSRQSSLFVEWQSISDLDKVTKSVSVIKKIVIKDWICQSPGTLLRQIMVTWLEFGTKILKGKIAIYYN